MGAAHPAAGSFGLYAEMYVHPWAGFAIRYTYWLCLVFIVGSEVVAASIYCKYGGRRCRPGCGSPCFSLCAAVRQYISIKSFGAFEYWFAMIKVVTSSRSDIGSRAPVWLWISAIGGANYTAYGGFFPNGWTGVGLGYDHASSVFWVWRLLARPLARPPIHPFAVPVPCGGLFPFWCFSTLADLQLWSALFPGRNSDLAKAPSSVF